jgi:lipopolysaccharide transport system permease protein
MREVAAVTGSRGAGKTPCVEIRPSIGWLPRLNLVEFWSYRELTLALALRDLKLRYRQTAIGVAWAVLQPLAGAALFSIFFGHLAKLPSDGIPYPVFVYAGLVVWWYFSSSILAAAESLVENHKLVTTVYFPRLVAPSAAILPGFVDLSISLVILGGFMAVYEVRPGLEMLTLPLWCAAAVATSLGVGLWLSALNVLYRDIRYAFGFVVQIWLFASPVVFSSSLVTGAWQYVYAVNPMVGVIDGFRWSLLSAPDPGPEDLVSLASALVLLTTGTVYFRRLERQFADRI